MTTSVSGTNLNHPALSVILSAFNAERFIQQAIESILKQSFIDFELLIVDDCSNDRTKSIINSFCDNRIRIFDNSKNKGKVANCNYLLTQVQGDFISIHDADDWSSPDRFEKQISHLRNNPDIVLCGSSFHTTSEDGKIISTNFAETDVSKIRENIRNRSQFHGPTIVFRRDLPDKVGGLFRTMTMGEDIDFTMRVIESFPADNVPEPLYYYRINTSSLTKSADHNLEEKFVDRCLIYTLAEERREGGLDSLMRNDLANLESYNDQARKDFYCRRISLTDEYVGYLLHYKLYFCALKFLYYQIKMHGFDRGLVRLIFYVLKRYFFDVK